MQLAIWTTTNTDEAANVAAGISIWRYGCLDLYPVNPPLVKFVASIPFLFHQPDIDWELFGKHLEQNKVGSRPEFSIGLSLVRQNTEYISYHFFLARLMCIPFSLVGAYFCWRWANELYGNYAGLGAFVLWCFSPNILTWSSMVMPDVPAASFGIMCGYFFWRWLKKAEWSEVFGVGVALGLVLLTKLTWVILFFVLPFLWIIWIVSHSSIYSWKVFRNQFAQLFVILVSGIFILNLGYGFEGTFTKLGDFKFASRTLAGKNSIVDNSYGGNRFSDTPLRHIPVPLPYNYVIGADLQKVDFEKGLPSYLNGGWSDHGWWYYYLECLLFKVPLGTLGLAILSIALCMFRIKLKEPKSNIIDELILLLPAIILFLFVSSQTGFSRHFRYVLPAFPFFMIGISKVFAIAFERGYYLRVIVCGLLLWSIGSCLSVFPHTMSYFNELAGGPTQGHRYLLDSSIDWGQDALNFKKWLANHPETKGIHLKMCDDVADSLFYSDNYPVVPLAPASAQNGSEDRSDIEEEEDNDPRRLGPRPGWFAISIKQIHERHGRYQYFLKLKPKYRIGYSIYVYHIALEEANLLRQQYDLPPIEKNNIESKTFFDDFVKQGQHHRLLKIALYTASEEDASGINDICRILAHEPLFSWQLINAKQIRDGKLLDFDVIIFPGGNATEQGKDLGTKGKIAIRDFVQKGGGYLGICAGGFLATTNDSYGLGLINARAITGSRYLSGQGYISQSVRGTGNINLELTDLGRQLYGTAKELRSIYYSSGPVFYHAMREDLPEFLSLSTFKTETTLYEYQKDEMMGKPSIIVAPFGNGKVCVISTHFEMSSGYDDVLEKFIWSLCPPIR
ncbi:MAG: glycosyltransferase family 39 protein [Planctomycetaceae bacterium]|nr:glycosyltransferase family 39 protein [Planctomycetaceae bacterium]